MIAQTRILLVLLGLSVLGLGCAGLMGGNAEKEAVDTSVNEFQDTAAKKAAREARARQKRLDAMPKKASHLPMIIQMQPQGGYTAAEVICTEGNFRKRCAFRDKGCSLAGVPTSANKGCEIFFQGATRAQWGPAIGGNTFICDGSGIGVTCTAR